VTAIVGKLGDPSSDNLTMYANVFVFGVVFIIAQRETVLGYLRYTRKRNHGVCRIRHFAMESFSAVKRYSSVEQKLSAKKDKTEEYSDMFKKWYKTAITSLSSTEKLTPISLDSDYEFAEGQIGGGTKKDTNTIVFSSEAFRSEHLDYVRMVTFKGGGYTVLNFVAFPNIEYELPIFGVDIVVLPSGSLAAIDLQPLSESPLYLEGPLYQPFQSQLKKWQTVLPSGGDLPEAAVKYFSSIALWSKFPAESNAGLMFLVGQAFEEYLQCYQTLLSSAEKHSDPEIKRSRNQTLRQYLNYRIENDPAKRLLNAAFGVSWTEQALSELMFPTRYIPDIDS
jgi:phycoerythrobilin:ferredoxin oxidoreductase